MAKLSHSGHTARRLPPELAASLRPWSFDKRLGAWNPDWPMIRDASDFWAYAYHQRSFDDGQLYSKSASVKKEWARRRHLLDADGRVPGWILKALSGDGISWIARMMRKERVSSEYFLPLLIPYPNRAPVPYVNPDLNFPIASPDSEEGELERDLQKWLDASADCLQISLYFDPARESHEAAMRRITKAFRYWLSTQLACCIYFHKYTEVPRLPEDELSLFWRFQCEGVPVHELIPKEKAGRPAQDLQSTVRKKLKRVAKRLGIKLRVMPSGRPRKKTMDDRD